MGLRSLEIVQFFKMRVLYLDVRTYQDGPRAERVNSLNLVLSTTIIFVNFCSQIEQEFHLLKVVGRGSKIHLQVGENYSRNSNHS